jgi:lysyl-tRNA synthetase class 2
MSGRPPPSDDWRPTASLETLHRRADLLELVRRFFRDRGYWEVETPLLSRDSCIDPWIDPVAVPPPGRAGETLYLQTSPEFAMKRLLAAGAEAIFQITRSFRHGESGARHNLEFTIVEWYRAGDTHFDQMAVTEELVRAVAAARVGPAPPALGEGEIPRITYDHAFQAALGTHVLDKSASELQRLALERRIPAPRSLAGDDLDGWRNLLLAEVVEPWLARQPAVILYDYPASQAALARVRPGVPDVAERFELYLSGSELCNGYHELTDAHELRRRMEHHNALRVAAGQPPQPVNSRLLDAMHVGLPPCSGVALGFDRLAMWRLGLIDIRDVIAFPFANA